LLQKFINRAGRESESPPGLSPRPWLGRQAHRLAQYSGYDASDKPARLTHLDYRDERAILIKGRMASAQVVWLGHGTLRRLLPSDDGAFFSPRPIVSSTSSATSFQQEPTAIFVRRRLTRGARQSRSLENMRDARFSHSSFDNVTAPIGSQIIRTQLDTIGDGAASALKPRCWREVAYRPGSCHPSARRQPLVFGCACIQCRAISTRRHTHTVSCRWT
jgi:hypothetical protein